MKIKKKYQNPRNIHRMFIVRCHVMQGVRAQCASRLRTPNWELLMLLATYHVDPDVLPCPGEEYKHDIYGGFNRKTEDDHPAYREFCRNLSRRIIEKILRYRRECPKGRYFGIVGMDASPTCSVKEIGPNKTGKGVLIQELERELKKINIVLPMVGWSPHDPFVYDRFEEVRKLIEAGYGNINGK